MRIKNADVHIKYWLAIIALIVLLVGTIKIKESVAALDEFQTSYEALTEEVEYLKAEG